MSATCASLSQFFQPLIDQGLTGAGTHIIQTFKDVNDVAFADDEFVKLYHETVTAQGLDSKQTTYATGWIFAWYMVEILRAGGHVRGRSRPRQHHARGSCDRRADAAAARRASSAEMNGIEDAYLTEGGQMAIYEVSDPTQLGTFTKVGDLIDNEGKLGTYASVVEAMEG